MSDPILESLYELSVKNRDAQFSSTKRLRDGLTERRYVGCVDVEWMALRKALRRRKVDFHDLGVEQGTDPGNVGFILRVVLHEYPHSSCACQPTDAKFLVILVVLMCVWKLFVR